MISFCTAANVSKRAVCVLLPSWYNNIYTKAEAAKDGWKSFFCRNWKLNASFEPKLANFRNLMRNLDFLSTFMNAENPPTEKVDFRCLPESPFRKKVDLCVYFWYNFHTVKPVLFWPNWILSSVIIVSNSPPAGVVPRFCFCFSFCGNPPTEKNPIWRFSGISKWTKGCFSGKPLCWLKNRQKSHAALLNHLQCVHSL